MNANADPRERPLRSVATREAIVATALLGSLALAALPAVERIAHRRRVMGASVLVAGGGVTPAAAADGRAVLEEWLGRGVAGRTVLHVGAFLHSVPPEGIARTLAPLRATAGKLPALREAILQTSGDRSYLWAAVELGVARRIVFVEPRGPLVRRAEELGLPPPRRGEPLDLGVRGLERLAYDRVPPLAEPVLLDVAASWFEDEEPESLLTALDAAGVQADVVTLNRMDGEPGVSDAARARLAAFAGALARVGAQGTPR